MISMKQITNIFLKEQGDHFDLVLISGKDTIVLACYDDRPLLLERFRFEKEFPKLNYTIVDSDIKRTEELFDKNRKAE